MKRSEFIERYMVATSTMKATLLADAMGLTDEEPTRIVAKPFDPRSQDRGYVARDTFMQAVAERDDAQIELASVKRDLDAANSVLVSAQEALINTKRALDAASAERDAARESAESADMALDAARADLAAIRAAVLAWGQATDPHGYECYAMMRLARGES